MKIKYIGLLLLTCLASTACSRGHSATDLGPVVASATGDARYSYEYLNRIISEVMRDQYGTRYDATHQCWEYTLKTEDGSQNYCMKANSPEVVVVKGGRQMYFFASNVTSMPGDARYNYAHVDTCLLGAFKLSLERDGKWTYLAANKEISEGTFGACGCNDAKFVKLSSLENYGWLFSSGGEWQGAVVLNYSIIVAIGDNFEDVSSIPEVTEDSQDVRYLIDIDDGVKEELLFPLRVKKVKREAVAEEFLVHFDPKTNQYSLPSK